jgi:hypothetical protein
LKQYVETGEHTFSFSFSSPEARDTLKMKTPAWRRASSRLCIGKIQGKGEFYPMQEFSTSQAAPPSSSVRSVQDYDPACTGLLDWRVLLRFLFRLELRLTCTMRIWRRAFDSFRGHIRSQSSREHLILNLGKEFVRLSSGCLQPNERTIFRAECTQELLAIHPWSDIVDLRVFLMGFDAGEQCAHYMAHRPQNGHQYESSPWLTALERIPDKIHHQIKSFTAR